MRAGAPLRPDRQSGISSIAGLGIELRCLRCRRANGHQVVVLDGSYIPGPERHERLGPARRCYEFSEERTGVVDLHDGTKIATS
jgi:hypothetical protein